MISTEIKNKKKDDQDSLFKKVGAAVQSAKQAQVQAANNVREQVSNTANAATHSVTNAVKKSAFDAAYENVNQQIKNAAAEQKAKQQAQIASLATPKQQKTYTATMSSGKQYTFDEDAANWIASRYMQDNADSYGLDNADQLAKKNGQMSASMLKTYKNSNVDQQLAAMGLPSEKYFEKYLGDYYNWKTGGMDEVFAQYNLPNDYWTKNKDYYQQDWKNAYENTAEDQQRKAKGLIPAKYEAKYTDTEIDDQLRARGLPPVSEFYTYRDKYNAGQDKDALYANAALAQTNLRLAGIKNDDTKYPDGNGGEIKGKDLYAQAFYNEAMRTNADGTYVYGNIMPNFQSGTSSAKTPELTGDYATDQANKLMAEIKSSAKEASATNSNSWDYDDYLAHYDDYYNKYFANQNLPGTNQLVSDAIAVNEREADADATKKYYDVDNSWFGESKKGLGELVTQYQQDHPTATYYTMFSDFLKNGVSLTNVRKAARSMQGDTKKNGDFNAISSALAQAEKDWAHTDELDAIYGANGYDVVEGKVIPKGATPVESATVPEDAKTFFNFGDAYANASKEYGATAESARAEQKALRNQQRLANRAEPASKQVDEDLLKQTKDAISIYRSAEAAYEDTYPGYGAPSEASREPINKANAILNELGYKSIYDAERYVKSIEKGEQEDEQLKKNVTAALRELDDAKADAELKGDSKSFQKVIDAENKVTSLLNVGSADEAREWLRTGELPAGEASFNGTAVTVDNDIKVVETYMEQNGGWNAKVAQQAFNELYRMGVSPDIISEAAAEMQDRFGEMEETFTEPEKPDAPGIDSMLEYVEANKGRGTDEATVNDTKKALERLLFDEDGNNIVLTNADSVIKAIDSVRNMPFTTPAAVDLALKDLGFSANGWFSGVADDLTNGWSTDEMVKLRLALGTERAVDVDSELPDDAKLIQDTFGLSDFWMGNPVSSPQKILRLDDFALRLEWANQQITAGTLTPGQAYNVLAEDGYQDELETLMSDEWHKAHFKEYIAPGLWAQSTESDKLLWDEMSAEERDAKTELMWEALSDEQKATYFGSSSWWKYDPSVKRTAGQAWTQQASALLPGLFTELLVLTPLTVLDSVDAAITGRPEMWDATKKVASVAQAISNYGSVDDFSFGTRSAEWVTSAAQELIKMEILGSIGGMVGEAFQGTGVGSKILKATASNSKIVSKVADMFMGAVQASPFVAESFAGHYREAKMNGLPNGLAAWYGAVTGLSEGLIEGFNFDKIWGKAIGSDKIVERLVQGGLDYLNMGINGQVLLSSLALGFLGESTEEFVGYAVETGMKNTPSLSPYFSDEDKAWSWKDAGEQALVGGLLGVLGAGLHSGSLTTRALITDYAVDKGDAELFRKVAPELAYSIGVAESLSESDLGMYKKGGAKIMSLTEYGQTLDQINNCEEGINKANDEIAKIEADAQKAIDTAESEVAKYDFQMTQYMDTQYDLSPEELNELADLESKKTAAEISLEDTRRKATENARVQTAEVQTRIDQAKAQQASLQKKVQEHWVGIYLANYNNLINGMTDEMVANIAQAYQNGATYEPETARALSKQAAAGVDLIRNGANNEVVESKPSKLAEAEANETMTEAEEVAKSPEDAATKARELAYNRVYKDQEAGKAYAEGRRGENDSKLTRVEFAENERQNFEAKTTAKLRRVTLELAGLEAKDGMSAKEIFAEAKKAMTPEAAQKLDMYQKLSKALGLDMVIRDVVAGTSGYVHDGKLYVTLNGKQSMLRVAAHELTHYMKGHANEQYDALRNHLVSEVGQEQFDQLVADKAKEYGLDLNTENGRLEADDEVCAELCEKMLENKDALEKFAQSDLDAAKTLKQRLAKTLVAIKSAIKSIGTSDAETKADLIKQQDTIESWYKGLSDAIDNANKAGKSTATTEAETATVTDTTVEAPQAPPVETNSDLFMGEESARREQLRTELEELAKKGTKVKDVSYQEVNDVLDRVILGDKSNYNKADYAQIRGMLAQLIPEVTAYVNGDASVDANVLNERLSAALDYMLDKYSEGSEDYYGLRDLIPSKIALTDTAYKDLRAKDMTLRQASNELTRALGGKFVNFIYKRAPSYNNAMTIDELWQTITDQYGEQNGVGNVGEDVLALIDYVNDRNGKSSFDDLYGSQREDMVSSQVGEFLDAVQEMMNNKTEDAEARHLLDEGYVPGELDEEAIDEAFIEDVDESYFENEINRLLGMRPVADEAAPVVYDTSVDAQGNKLSDEQVGYFENSQVRSKDGQLRPVYHYTNGTFTEFKPMPASEHSNRTLGDGYYVSVLPTEYQAFGKNRMVMYANITNPFEMELTPEQAAYVYDKYAAPFHEDKFGLYREHAIDSLQSFTKSMDYLREYADANGIGTSDILKDLGFDGIHDGPDWVAFDSNQLKFTDNKTPTTRNDLRFAVDNDLVEQYGAIEQGREPRARDVQVPRQVDDQTRVSKLARSAAESPIMSDEHAEKILNDIEADKDRIKKVWSYIPVSNDEMAKKAREFISDKQPASAQREFHDMVTSGNTSLLTEAVGLQLLADAAMRDDWVSVDELLFDLRVLATDAGQRSQIFNTLKELKGIGSAWYLEKLVDKLNTQYADAIRTGEIDGPITVSDAAMQQVRAAKTQAEVDAAEAVVAKELAVQLPLTWDEKLSNWRFLSMLGNPITHVRNFTGNKLMYRMGGIKDVVASGIQRLLEGTGITDASDRAHALLTPSDWKYWDNFAQKSYEEQRSNLQGGGKLGFQSLLQQNKRSFDNKVLDAIARGKNPGVMSEKGRVAGLLENIKNNGAMGMLEVADAWGLEDNYKRSLTEYMKAQGYELRNGVVGKTSKDGGFTEISTEAMNKAIEWASSQAWTNTFRGPSEFATALNKISKINPVMRLVVEGVMPFKKTPVNIAKQGFWYSPAGAIVGTAELLTKVKQGKMSAATAIDHISSGLTGTALMALGVVLAKAGILRGGGEDKKKLETYLEDTGDQTYAFKFGNVSINMSAIAPATIPLFMGVALQEMLSRNGEDEGVDLSTITDVLAGTLNPFMEMSFMSSLNSALKNYNNEGIGGALGSTIMTAAQNYGSQYLPTLGGKVAQFVDPTQRTTKSSATSPVGGNLDYYWRSLVKKVPGAEATLQPDVNIWGQTTTKDSFGDWALDFANKFILPTNVKVTNRDAVDNELIRVVESTGIADFLPSDGNKYFTVKGETYKMNASQYTQYSQERGQAAYAALKDTMASASYKNASDEDKAVMLKKALDSAYKVVNNTWKEKLGAYNK